MQSPAGMSTRWARADEVLRSSRPHRDFIGLDPLFENAHAMNVGDRDSRLPTDVGKHTWMLAISYGATAAVLCDNPHCRDCVQQRADISARGWQMSFR